MGQAVNASIISKLLDLLKNISSNLQKSLNSLLEIGAEYENVHKDKDGNVVFTVTVYTGEDNNEKHQFKVKVLESKDSGKVELHFKHPNGDVVTKTVKDDKAAFDKAFQSVASEWFGADAIEDAVDQRGKSLYESKHLDVTLQRVCSDSNEDSVNLLAVNCSYNPSEALVDLNSVLDDAEFVATLTEEPQSFSITESDDDMLDVEVCDPFEADGGAQLLEILQKAYKLVADAQYFQWSVHGYRSSELITLCETVRYLVDSQITALIQYAATCNLMKVPHLFDLVCSDSFTSKTEYVDVDWLLSHLAEDVSDYIQAMDLYCCNLPDPIHQACSEYSFSLTSDILSRIQRYQN